MPNNWISALKIFNEGKSEWCIPKKGGKEYEEIKKIMNGETMQIVPKSTNLQKNKNHQKNKTYKITKNNQKKKIKIFMLQKFNVLLETK